MSFFSGNLIKGSYYTRKQIDSLFDDINTKFSLYSTSAQIVDVLDLFPTLVELDYLLENYLTTAAYTTSIAKYSTTIQAKTILDNALLDYATSASLTSAVDLLVPSTDVGVTVCPLDNNKKVGLQYLPPQSMIWQGMWNPATNTPLLYADGHDRVHADYFMCSAGGTWNSMTFQTGDWIIWNQYLNLWQKSQANEDVVSWNTRLGAIMPLKADYSTWFYDKGEIDTKNLTFLTKISAAELYQPVGSYLTTTDATTTYLTKASATLLYQPVGSYLTSVNATSTYKTIASFNTDIANYANKTTVNTFSLAQTFNNHIYTEQVHSTGSRLYFSTHPLGDATGDIYFLNHTTFGKEWGGDGCVDIQGALTCGGTSYLSVLDVSGLATFSSIPSCSILPTTNNHLVNLSYLQSNYSTTSTTNTAISNAVAPYALASTLSSYKTITSFNSDILNYSTTTAMTTAISNAVAPYALASTLSSYKTINSFNSDILNYATKTYVDTGFASLSAQNVFTNTQWFNVNAVIGKVANVNNGILIEGNYSDYQYNGSAGVNYLGSCICNDVLDHKALMICGNKSSNYTQRRVQLWDDVYLPNGNLTLSGAGPTLGILTCYKTDATYSNAFEVASQYRTFCGYDLTTTNKGVLIERDWTGFMDDTTGSKYGSVICNDVISYKALMIAGNFSSLESKRKIKMYDFVQVNGELEVQGSQKINNSGNGNIITTHCNSTSGETNLIHSKQINSEGGFTNILFERYNGTFATSAGQYMKIRSGFNGSINQMNTMQIVSKNPWQGEETLVYIEHHATMQIIDLYARTRLTLNSTAISLNGPTTVTGNITATGTITNGNNGFSTTGAVVCNGVFSNTYAKATYIMSDTYVKSSYNISTGGSVTNKTRSYGKMIQQLLARFYWYSSTSSNYPPFTQKSLDNLMNEGSTTGINSAYVGGFNVTLTGQSGPTDYYACELSGFIFIDVASDTLFDFSASCSDGYEIYIDECLVSCMYGINPFYSASVPDPSATNYQILLNYGMHRIFCRYYQVTYGVGFTPFYKYATDTIWGAIPSTLLYHHPKIDAL